MTTKEKILAMLPRQDKNAFYDDLIYKLEFMNAVEQGLSQAKRGLATDHDEFFAHLEAEDAAEQAEMDANSKNRPARHKDVHRKNGTNSRATYKT